MMRLSFITGDFWLSRSLGVGIFKFDKNVTHTTVYWGAKLLFNKAGALC